METSVTWIGRLAGSPDGDDWRRLDAAYRPLLLGWAARAGVGGAAEDVVQDVMVAVVERVGEFEHRGPGAFRAWLRGILANHVRRHFARRRATPGVDLDAVADPHIDLGRVWDREHDEYFAARALRAAEGDFAPATWAAFRMQVVDGRGAAAAAAAAGITLNAALLAKSRVLKRLREELRGLTDG